MADFLDAVFSAQPEPPPTQPAKPDPQPQNFPPPAISSQPVTIVTAPLMARPETEERLKAVERELAAEREKALAAEVRLSEMQKAQATVEETLEKLYQKMSRERTDQEMRVIREKATARVDALEGRLDEFQKGVLDLLRQQNEARGSSDRQANDQLVSFLKTSQEQWFSQWSKMIESLREDANAREKAHAEALLALRQENHQMQSQFEECLLSVGSTIKEKLKELEGKTNIQLQQESQVQNRLEALEGTFRHELQTLEEKFILTAKVSENAIASLFKEEWFKAVENLKKEFEVKENAHSQFISDLRAQNEESQTRFLGHLTDAEKLFQEKLKEFGEKIESQTQEERRMQAMMAQKMETQLQEESHRSLLREQRMEQKFEEINSKGAVTIKILEDSIAKLLESLANQWAQAFENLRQESRAKEKSYTEAMQVLRGENRQIRSEIDERLRTVRGFLEEKLTGLDVKISMANKVSETARIVIHAINLLDPMWIERPVVDELAKIKEYLEKGLNIAPDKFSD